MNLQTLYRGAWVIQTPVRATEAGKLTNELSERLGYYAGRQYLKQVEGLVGMLQRCAEVGPEGLPPKWGHVLDKKHGIAEFKKGALRLIYFKADSGAVIVCSHVFLKKSQKTPPSEIRKAVKLKADYQVASKQGRLKVYKQE